MEDEFDRILNFFSLSDKEKELRLKDVFNDSVAYFERFRHIMLNGTPEEKQAAMGKVAKLKERIENETKKICERTGLTERELMERAQNPKNFSETEWNALNEAQSKIKQGVEEVRRKIEGVEEDTSTHAEQKKAAKKPPKKWIQS